MEKIITEYFIAWNAQDLNALRKLMNDDLQLTDWLTEVKGIDKVLGVNAAIYQSFPNANIEVLDIACAKTNKVMAQIIIRLKDDETLQVVDVFDIEKDKIAKITAYKI